jgi:hypothetical protein
MKAYHLRRAFFGQPPALLAATATALAVLATVPGCGGTAPASGLQVVTRDIVLGERIPGYPP